MSIRRSSLMQSVKTQRGLSLVELMVALTIGLFLLGAVGIIYVNTSNTSRSSTLEAQMNEDGAVALELLQQQIRLAGFSNVDNSGARLFSGRAVLGCDGGFSSNAGGTAFEALTCSASAAGSDALAVRYEANELNSQTVLNPAGVRVPANCVNEGIAAWNALAEGASSATPMVLADNRYYVANDADGTPSLFCQGRTGAGFGNATALVPNVENMQIEYGITRLPTTGGIVPHHVAGYVQANNAALGATAANWSRVAAVRICLIVRSATAVPTGDNTIADVGYYRDCAGNVPNPLPTDRFLRRAYVTTIQLRNVRPALPANYQAGVDPWSTLYEN